jgi:PPM family protein phosphatase
MAVQAVPRRSSEPPPGRQAPDREGGDRPPPAATRQTEEPSRPARRRRRRRIPVGVVVALVALAILATGAFAAVRAVFFLGLDEQRAVTVYRGLPYELPLGIELYTRHYTSGVTIDQVPAARRETFTDHQLRSLEDATDLVEQLETGRLRR